MIVDIFSAAIIAFAFFADSAELSVALQVIFSGTLCSSSTTSILIVDFFI